MSTDLGRALPQALGTSPGREPSFRSRFESLGLHLPAQRQTSRDLIDSCRHRVRIDLERLTGIRERRICGEGEDSYTLAVDAAFDCLEHSRHEARDLEMVVSCSITRYKGADVFSFEPPLSHAIKEAVGASQALNFDVSNACAGMLTGVAILDDFIRRGVVRCGMVVSGEKISSISQNATRAVRTILSSQLASLTVGDAGSAVILERAENGSRGIEAIEFATYAEHDQLCIGKACATAPGATMKTNPRKLHDVAIKAAVPSLAKALERCDLSLDEIDHLVPHQTSVRAIRAGQKHVQQELGAMAKNVIVNLDALGNTASTTHFVALYKQLQEGNLAPGERVVLICYASGLVVGSLIFSVDELVEGYGHDH